MPLATKNGSLIVKGGQLAENCGCCGGWYCYNNVCQCPSIKGVTVSISSSDKTFTYPGGDFRKVRGSLVSGTHTLSLASTSTPNSNSTGIVKTEVWVAWPYTLGAFQGYSSLGILDPEAATGGYYDTGQRQQIASASAGKTPGIIMSVGYKQDNTVVYNRIDVLVLVLTAVGPMARFEFGDKYGYNEIVPDDGNTLGDERQSQSGVQSIVQFPLGCVPPHGSPNTLKVLVPQAPGTTTLFSETDVTLNSIVFQT